MILKYCSHLLISDVLVGVFYGTRCFLGIAPVQELFFEQGGLIVLSQSAEHCPVRSALTFPTGEPDNTITEKVFITLLLQKSCEAITNK